MFFLKIEQILLLSEKCKNNKVWRRPGQVKTKPLFAQKILGKIFGTKIKKSSKTGKEKKSLTSTFACLLTVNFKVSFLEERLGTRLCLHPNLIFSQYLLIFWDPKSQVVRQLVRQLVYQVCYTRYYASFYLCLIGSAF